MCACGGCLSKTRRSSDGEIWGYQDFHDWQKTFLHYFERMVLNISSYQVSLLCGLVPAAGARVVLRAPELSWEDANSRDLIIPVEGHSNLKQRCIDGCTIKQHIDTYSPFIKPQDGPAESLGPRILASMLALCSACGSELVGGADAATRPDVHDDFRHWRGRKVIFTARPSANSHDQLVGSRVSWSVLPKGTRRLPRIKTPSAPQIDPPQDVSSTVHRDTPWPFASHAPPSHQQPYLGFDHYRTYSSIASNRSYSACSCTIRSPYFVQPNLYCTYPERHHFYLSLEAYEVSLVSSTPEASLSLHSLLTQVKTNQKSYLTISQRNPDSSQQSHCKWISHTFIRCPFVVKLDSLLVDLS